MFSPDDTIVATATPPGRGGIGVVRISGPDAPRIARALTDAHRPFVPRHATLVRVDGGRGTADRAIVTWFPAPHSYTGEDVVEISAHGSPVLLTGIVEAAVAAGARLAEPGEFTLRAFLRERMDLVQAEAVRDLVDAVTPLQARAAFDQLEGTLTAEIRDADAELLDLVARLEASLDFPEEGYHFVEPGTAAGEIAEIRRRLDCLLETARRGRLVREGLQVAIAGRPNAGKSSLFNALVGAGRAIVTAVPGTTRDLLTETVDIEGIPMMFVDTAGIHGDPADVVETEGIARAVAARDVSAVVLVVLDRSTPLTADDRRLLDETRGRSRVVVANKCDLPKAWHSAEIAGSIQISARTGAGLDDLRSALAVVLTGSEPLRDVPAMTNIRHVDLVTRARDALLRAERAVAAAIPEEFVLDDLNDARERLEEVTGRRAPDDLLRVIFENFCIGK